MPSPEIEKCEANQRVAVVQLRELADLIEAGTIIMRSVEFGCDQQVIDVGSFPDKEFNRCHASSIRTLTMNFIRKE